MSEQTNTPRYSIITQDSAPGMLRDIFALNESRYVRRSRYIEDISNLKRAVQRLSLSNDHMPYVDHSGNIVYQT